jgi:protein-arginine kinase
MKRVTVYTTDKEYNHFIQLARNLHYVKKIELDEEPSKEDILDNIKAGLEEVQLFKKGKLKTSSAKAFLNEL